MEFTVENISGLLIRSKLLNAEEVRSMYQRWLAEGKDHLNSSPHYLKWMVQNQFVTEYQAALISRGLADDFFLGPYKILDRLGKGRMAGVYKAVHQSGQMVAIKVLPPSRAKDSQSLARFQREARLAMKLKHPNVVRSFQLGDANGLQYLVMEYLDGETLDEVLQRRKKLPHHEAVRLIHQALQGLQHIHEKGMIHRDLKPANLMLVPARTAGEPDTTLNATVKILDIGLGRELFEEATKAAVQNLQLTGEGVLLGTPDYLAPEQARDPRSIDIRADIYSLGCVLYHLLTGQPPFPDTNVLNQMVRHATETPTPVSDFSPGVPDGVQQVLNWMMAKEPGQRYPTPERAAQALNVFLVAGAEARPLEEAPQMRRYLTWLETGDKGAPPEAVAAIPALPAAPPVAAVLPPPAEPPAVQRSGNGDRNSRKPSRKERREKQAAKQRPTPPVAAPVAPPPVPSAAPPPVPMAVTAASAPEEVDVELVTLPPPGTSSLSLRSLLMVTLRDWIFLGIGAGAVIFAMLIGWLLARIF